MAMTFIAATFGGIGISKADIFQTDTFSGTLTLKKPLPDPAFGNLLKLNYTGTTTFDQTKVAALSPALQVYSSFIKDGGNVSVTLDTLLGHITFSSSNLPSGSPKPTLVVQNNKAVGFDFDIFNSSFVPIELKLNAPIPNPVQPSSGTKSYTGVQDNLTLSVTLPFFGTESILATTVPKFVVIPEPSTWLLVCGGISALGFVTVRRRATATV